MQKGFLTCLVQTLLCLACFAQTPNKKTDRYLATEMKERQIPGLQLVVMRGDRVVLSLSKGMADMAFHTPVTDSTIFSINSACKIFAGVGILQLVEAGAISLDDPVGRHLDSLPQLWRGITIKQLMGHISGLPDVEDGNADGLVGGNGEDSAWRLVQRLPLLAKPGETFNYNATNYLLIQKILEKFGLMPYEAWLRQEQFSIAALRHTFFANSDEVVTNKTPSYSYYFYDPKKDDFVKKSQLRQLQEDFPRMMRTDAGAFSTAQELASWIKSLKTGQLLKKAESLHNLWTPVRLNNGTTEGFGGAFSGYALGWSVIDRKEHPAVAGVGGGRAAIMVYPDDDLTVILLTNLSGCAPDEIADVIAGYYFNH